MELAPGYSQIAQNAAAETGAGSAIDVIANSYGRYPERFTWTSKSTGTPTGVTVLLEGTIDNVNWFELDRSVAIVSEMRHVVNKGVNQIRTNLSALTGGSTPTVTTRIAAF
jgi:hypothetical protein